MSEWYNRLRVNTLALVKQGFSREEIFYMPLTEINDYIRILNEQHEEEKDEINRENAKANSNSGDSINDIKMAGNTVF